MTTFSLFVGILLLIGALSSREDLINSVQSQFIQNNDYLYLQLIDLNYIQILKQSLSLSMLKNQLLYHLAKPFTHIYRFSIAKQVESMHQKNPSSIYNITPNILAMTDRKLLKVQSHPLSIMTQKITQFFGPQYHTTTDSNPIVTVQNNFDALNIPKDHVSRKPTDTYYINEEYLLRTHTSAHQKDNLQSGKKNFLFFGDVYRRDQIDRFHYPVFHQMEAVSMLGSKDKVTVQETVKDLKSNLQRLAIHLFGNCEMRWVDAYFPFTEPSFQLEVFFEGKWVQMLGCGVIHQSVLDRSGRSSERGWAAGLGLERFAMRLFKIPDVRLFWSQDKRFLEQFEKGKITEFKQFSKYPVCFKDLSMWITPEYNPNDLFGLIREIGGDLIQSVDEVDTFVDEKNKRTSKAYRICFRSLERTLKNDEITKYQFDIRKAIQEKLSSVKLR